jgi:hypothetical protein
VQLGQFDGNELIDTEPLDSNTTWRMDHESAHHGRWPQLDPAKFGDRFTSQRCSSVALTPTRSAMLFIITPSTFPAQACEAGGNTGAAGAESVVAFLSMMNYHTWYAQGQSGCNPG